MRFLKIFKRKKQQPVVASEEHTKFIVSKLTKNKETISKCNLLLKTLSEVQKKKFLEIIYKYESIYKNGKVNKQQLQKKFDSYINLRFNVKNK